MKLIQNYPFLTPKNNHYFKLVSYLPSGFLGIVQAKLSEQTKYFVEVTNGITDNSGNALTKNMFSFTTGDFTAPTVVIATGQSNVSLMVPVGIQFSKLVQNVNLKTVSLHYGSPIGLKININLRNINGSYYEIIPDRALDKGTYYYIVFDRKSIIDDFGNSMGTSSINFKTLL